MRYYCNICKKDITKSEFLYSLDKFDRPLCREHQQIKREIHEPIPKHELEVETEETQNQETVEEEIIEESESRLMSSIKRGLVAAGKGIVKGTKKLVDASRKSMQIRSWKEDMLRRMRMSQLKRLCFEKRISTKKTVTKQDGRSGELYFKQFNCTKEDLVKRIRNKISLEDIESFAKRNHVNIRDILRDINQKKAEWELKEITEKIQETGVTLIDELVQYIMEFKPSTRYSFELPYQTELAGYTGE